MFVLIRSGVINHVPCINGRVLYIICLSDQNDVFTCFLYIFQHICILSDRAKEKYKV